MSRIELRRKWEERIRAFRVSGQSAVTWCADHEISVATLHYWLRRFPPLPPVTRAPSQVHFLELDMTSIPVSNSPSLTIRIGEIAIDVPRDFDPTLLRQVVAALTAVC